jgi:hypothetical protein
MQSVANIIRIGTSRRMRGTGRVACVRTCGGTTEGNSPFGRQTCRWTIILE